MSDQDPAQEIKAEIREIARAEVSLFAQILTDSARGIPIYEDVCHVDRLGERLLKVDSWSS